MTENKKKNYLASHIKAINGDYGEFFSAKFRLKDLMEIESNGWVSLIITKRREESEKGATHTAYEDTYNPTEKSEEFDKPQATQTKIETPQQSITEVETDDLPF